MPSHEELMNSVVELPDGGMVCRAHGLVVCGRCCVDFSFLDEIDNEDSLDEEEDIVYDDEEPLPDDGYARNLVKNLLGKSEGQETGPDMTSIRRGTGLTFPTMFDPPPGTTPEELFPPATVRAGAVRAKRYIHRSRPRQVLIYVDGACLSNGLEAPRGGWGFVFKPARGRDGGDCSARLESKGPFGDEAKQTSNRAELRAVLAALRFHNWKGEGFNTIVLATDSEYVATGATEWIRKWVGNGWRTSTGAVQNKDLWQAILGEAERWALYAVKIQFWRIPRKLNGRADAAARRAAMRPEEKADYYDVSSGLV